MMDMPIDVTMVCPFCGKEHSVTVNFDDCLAWNNGALVHKTFPYLSATEREQLISGLCPDCQKNFFKEMQR